MGQVWDLSDSGNNYSLYFLFLGTLAGPGCMRPDVSCQLEDGDQNYLWLLGGKES